MVFNFCYFVRNGRNFISILAIFLLLHWTPKAGSQINPSFLGKGDAFCLKKLLLYIRAAKRKRRRYSPLPIDYPMTRDHSRHGVTVQGIPYRPGRPRAPAEESKLSVGRNPALRDSLHSCINLIVKAHLRESPFLSLEASLFSCSATGPDQPADSSEPLPSGARRIVLRP